MIYVLIILLGSLVGNMINAIGTYLPYSRNEDKNSPEICPQISYFTQISQTCKHCFKPDSTRYFITPILTSIVSIIIIHYSHSLWETGFNLILAWSLILLTIIDYEHFLLPDIITLPMIWLGLIINAFYLFTSPELAILGASSAYLLLYFVSKIFKFLRGIDGLGRGDCKLFAVFGAWWGIHSLIPILFVASLTGSIIGLINIFRKKQTRETYIPFGPYLAFAGVLTIFSHIVELHFFE